MTDLSGDDDDVRVPVAAISESDMGRRTMSRRLRLPDNVPGVATSPRRRFKLPGITFRRRRDGEKDKDEVFWNAVMVLSVLSLGVLTAIAFVLAQTEFFITHQVDLLGVSIDKIFSVVSEEKTTIFLHNTGHLPGKAILNYEDHVLTLGRVKAAAEEELPYYGLSIHHNGTVGLTNELRAPNIEATTVHADSVIFLDGTTMTTAADISGGLLQEGDLNFASQKGSIVAATSGKQRFLVNADGLVIVPNPDATPPDDPNKVGIVLDGQRNRMRFGDHLDIFADKTTAGMTSTAAAFALAANDIAVGRDGTERVRLTCPAVDKVSFGKPMRLEVVGQFAKSGPGGDVVVAGGDGAGSGGDLWLMGGQTAAPRTDSATHLGSVFINSPATDSGVVIAATSIGSNVSTNVVSLQGTIQLNAQSMDLPVEVGGNVSVRGSALTVTSSSIALGVPSTETIQVEAKRVDVTAPRVAIQGGVVQVTRASDFVVNVTAGVSMVSPVANVTTKTVSVHADDAMWTTRSTLWHSNETFQVTGQSIRLGAHSTTITSTDDANGTTSLGGTTVHVGDTQLTREVHIHTAQALATHVNGTTLTMAQTSDNAISITSASGLVVGDAESATQIRGKSVHVAATDLHIGSPSSTVNMEGTVTLNGKPWPAASGTPATRRLNEVEWMLQAHGHTRTKQVRLMEAFLLGFDTIETVSPHDAPVEVEPLRHADEVITLGNLPTSGRLEFDLTVHGFRAEMAAITNADSMLIRCQVVRHADTTNHDVVVEASVDVDVCPFEWRCLDDTDAIAPTLHGRSIVALTQRDSNVPATYSAVCASRLRRRRHQDSTAAVHVSFDRVALNVRRVV
ncbi:hypothetical protein H310_07099 [Aphanomyces invadans]|uniref:Uncharacterized protein n=1 Tax=Aphanomyces invadans TaxID=157072 RepID=A0A024U3M4_9STRA|nr:hypothetical protein H310_07099 [Aphanomyces invadans]ETW00482.1 hypothetical protein H310_07099 [Aphanomyces invadans]|eukprot:XP_008870617.1 hypothetical protein H310_07099 [Aphanomyces invadans]